MSLHPALVPPGTEEARKVLDILQGNSSEYHSRRDVVHAALGWRPDPKDCQRWLPPAGEDDQARVTRQEYQRVMGRMPATLLAAFAFCIAYRLRLIYQADSAEWLQVTTQTIHARLEAVWTSRNPQEVKTFLEGYLAGLIDAASIRGYSTLKGPDNFITDVMRAISKLPQRRVRDQAHANPALHFIKEYTQPLDEEEPGALASAELVAAWKLLHPSDHRTDRALAMMLSGALHTIHARLIKDNAIIPSKHLSHTCLQGHLPNGKEARGWIGLRLSKVDQEQVRRALI